MFVLIKLVLSMLLYRDVVVKRCILGFLAGFFMMACKVVLYVGLYDNVDVDVYI